MPVVEAPEQRGTGDHVEWDPGKVMRIQATTGRLVEELRRAPLDDPARARLATVHARAVRELADALPGPMRQEFARLIREVNGARSPSEGEVRVAGAQLLGWLTAVVMNMKAGIALQALMPSARPDRYGAGEPSSGERPTFGDR
jgi:proteasome activator-like protein